MPNRAPQPVASDIIQAMLSPRARLIAGRALGTGLLLLAYLPLHRLLDPTFTGTAGTSTRAAAEAAWRVGLLGTVIVLGLALPLSRLVPIDRLARATRPVLRLLERPPRAAFAISLGVASFGLSAWIAVSVFGGLPTSVDEMVQLLHARTLAGGQLARPVGEVEAAWAVQNGLLTPSGWTSVYPPGHTGLLAIGLMLGVPWLVGPIAVGVATAALAAALERLLSGVRTARLAALLVALGPFWLLLGGTHLSHTTAAAGAALVLWTALLTRDGSSKWGLAVGASVGVFVLARPWVGIVVSTAVILSVWLPPILIGLETRGWGLRRVASTLAGGAPFAFLLLAWNQRLYGSPLRLGYSAAFGPAHGLGLHVDPWGNRYGWLEALAYTGADAVQLGAHLLETPLPALALIGAAFLLGGLPRGAGVLCAWAGAALLANALYWHHGVHMGPRMLYESAPAWASLFAVAAVSLLESDAAPLRRYRDFQAWVVLLALFGGAALAPGVVRGHASPSSVATSAELPSGVARSSVVFAHGSWASRVSARLASSGMRRDSIETALRRNDICAVDAYARSRDQSPGTSTDRLDFDALPGTPGALELRELSPGNVIRVSPSRAPTPSCLREARADRLGVIELEPLLWQAPPLPGRPIVVARDMGPVKNAKLISALRRTPYLYVDFEGEPRLMEYAAGMELIWGGPVDLSGPRRE